MTTPDAPQRQETEVDTPEESQVLTFSIGEQSYCLSIDYVAEVVDGEGMTALPDTADYVEGIMDLRGSTTTIINPEKILETDTADVRTDGGDKNHRFVVLDSERVNSDSPIGWVVSEVHEVRTITADIVDTDAIGDTDLLRGLVSEDDGFTIWLNPSQFVA